MSETYTTKQGDAWDGIAHQVYGDVKYTGYLMQNNFRHLDTFIFGAGTVLNTPALPDDENTDSLPIWRS